MSSEQIVKLRALIEETISRMQTLKPLMREDELEEGRKLYLNAIK